MEINLLVCSIKPLTGDNDRRFTFEVTTPSQGCTQLFFPPSFASRSCVRQTAYRPSQRRP